MFSYGENSLSVMSSSASVVSSVLYYKGTYKATHPKEQRHWIILHWTSENHVSFLVVLAHWLILEFEKREELLDFVEIQGWHSGYNLADHVQGISEELGIVEKLLTITRDNAGNNITHCDSLHAALLKEFREVGDLFPLKPFMRFRGRASFIPCLAHIIDLICKEVLRS